MEVFLEYVGVIGFVLIKFDGLVKVGFVLVV